uniref:Neuroguidin n=1 Tax=Latimeria chalumnae TaxID=7897 RepID=H3AA34_LATCH
MGVTAHVQGLIKRVRSRMFSTAKGIGFLEVKYQLLLSYLMDLAHLMIRKVDGSELKNEDAILRLVEIRTVLEKMRPIDQKLKYQIDKLVKTAITGSVGANDPLHFKPNPDNLASKLDESSGEEEEEDEEAEGEPATSKKSSGSKPKRYVPPRLVPMHYDADESSAEKQRKALERAKKHALSSSVIRELKEQHSDAPEEIQESRNFHMMRQSKEDQHSVHRARYEEEMMVRLNMTKKERARKRQAMTMTSQLNSITHFGDISALTGEVDTADGDLIQKKKKQKVTKKKGKKKVFFLRDRH